MWLTDNALASFASAIIQALELAAAAASGTQNAEQRAALGRAVESVQQALLIVANGRNGNGFALFGGQSAGAAYEDTGAGIV